MKKKTPTERIAMYKQNIPKIYHSLYEKAIGGKSYASIVKFHCLDCCCWQRKEVSLCPAVECPAWSKRPYQNASESDNPSINGGVEEKTAETVQIHALPQEKQETGGNGHG